MNGILGLHSGTGQRRCAGKGVATMDMDTHYLNIKESI
jgi:hypothetical protein